MTRRNTFIVVVVVLAAAATITIVLSEKSEPPAADRSKGIVVRDADDSSERDDIAEASELLNSLPAAIAAQRADWLANASPAATDVRQVLPPRSTVTVDRTSWRRTGAIASLTVEVPNSGGSANRFSVVLVKEHNAWKVSETYPAGAR